MDRTSTYLAVQGFTLVELMLVLVVLAIALSIGTPSLQAVRQGSQLWAGSSRFLAALNLARSEAVMRNQPVSLCPYDQDSGGEPECVGTYAAGWLVFSNRDRDKVVDADADEVIRVFEGLPTGYRLTNRSGTKAASQLINFLPDGTAYANRTLLFCPPQPVTIPSLSIVLNIVGRARLLRGRDSCPAA